MDKVLLWLCELVTNNFPPMDPQVMWVINKVTHSIDTEIMLKLNSEPKSNIKIDTVVMQVISK